MTPAPKLPITISAALMAMASLVRAELVDVANLATASQTSEWNGGQFPAALAIDGNPSTFSHTDGTTPNNALDLILDAEYEIAKVELAMRADCCPGRLTGATLRLFDGEGDSVFDAVITDPGQGQVAEFNIPDGVAARSLRAGFENGAATWVHLGEVRVFIEVDLFPLIHLFQADPSEISSGAFSQLSWQTESADSVELAGSGAVAATGTMSVSPTSSEVFTIVATNERGSRIQSLAIIVDGEFLPPRITEFMTDNATTVSRSDGSSPDWIELWNPNPVDIDLVSHRLTDDPEEPDKYTFPPMILPAGGYLIVDADAVSRDGVPATGFKLNSSADSYLALLSPSGVVLQSFTYPKQREDISYGIDGQGEAGFFLPPTPGEATVIGGMKGFVSDTQFSARRGFYDQPQTVTISTETQSATIYTTTDGSEPSPENPAAAIYSGPMTISTTTILRAAAFRDGYVPTDVDTQTYLFPSEVASQSSTPANFPLAWVPNLNGVVSSVPKLSHFGMDDEVLVSFPLTDRAGEIFGIQDALLDIPTMSLVMNIDELLDPADGIHVNARSRGKTWERAGSIEIMDPNTGETAQANCGVRMHGGWNRYPEMLKKSFRLYFRSEYGDAKLKFPLFPNGVTDEFDRILLRSGNGKAWPSPWRALSGGGNSLERNTYLRDQFMRDLQATMGHDHVAGNFVHLYLNGHYWGLYNPVERPDEHFASSHYGGQDEDYDVMKWIRGTGHRAAAGSDEGWNQLIALSRSGPANQATYEAISERLDLPNFIDYMMLNFYGGNQDWVDSNVYALRDRARDGPYKFYCWDSEETFLSPGRDSTEQHVNDTSTELHHDLRTNAEYRVLFGDRAQKHFFNGGALTQERADAVLMRRAWEVDRAIVGDSARWGNLLRPSNPYDREDWLREIANLRSNYLGPRVGTTLAQLRADGLFPNVDAPEFLPQRGGEVDSQFVLFLSPPADQEGTVFYTIDGTDPRAVGGSVSPTAREFTGGVVEEIIVAEMSAWHYRDDGADLGTSDIVEGHQNYGAENWKHSLYDDALWDSGPAPLGYGILSGATLQTLIGYGPDDSLKYPTTYFRHHFTLSDAGRFNALRLRLMRDDGAVVYLNGHEIARSEFPAGTTTVSADTFAVGVGGASEGVFQEFMVLPDSLVDGLNILALEVHQASFNSSDLGFDLELSGDALPLGAQGISFVGDTLVRARVLLDGEWSALDEALFTLGDRADDLYLSELMYHPASPNSDEAEFIELGNRGSVSHHLFDLRITGGIQFDFSNASVTELAPGGRLVLARNRLAFETAYPGVVIAGVFEGALGNGGDSFTLEQNDGTLLWTINYDDGDPWPGGTDGEGHSLTYITGDLSMPSSWRPSVSPGGSPGIADAIPFSGGDLIEYAVDETSIRIGVDASPEFQITTKLGADDAIVGAEWSVDLITWITQDLVRVRQVPLGEGTAHEVWKLDAEAGVPLFFRAIVSER